MPLERIFREEFAPGLLMSFPQPKKLVRKESWDDILVPYTKQAVTCNSSTAWESSRSVCSPNNHLSSTVLAAQPQICAHCPPGTFLNK